MKYFLVLALICGTFVTAVAQNGNRFPAPLGIERIVTGVVERTNPSTSDSDSRPSRYRLSSGSVVYALHGQETKLKKYVGKQVRITGHVVGNDVDVQSVEASITKD